jgi:hypothetical protein
MAKKIVGEVLSGEDRDRLKKVLVDAFLERARIALMETKSYNLYEGDTHHLSFSLGFDAAVIKDLATKAGISLQKFVDE